MSTEGRQYGHKKHVLNCVIQGTVCCVSFEQPGSSAELVVLT